MKYIMFYSKLLLLITPIMMMMSLLLLYKSILISISIPISFILSTYMNITIMFDWMSTMFLTTIMMISSMILMFSYDYIPKKEHKIFSMLLIMFVTSMLILITSNNLIMMIVGWDGLGLSSYVLVIYYQNPSSSASGLITILSNRIGDIMILMSMGILFMTMNWNFYMNMEFPLLIMTLMIIAAITKSAQFPFSAWLPAAMAAPTPISALVHSSTLVTAGVYLLMRMMSHPHPNTMFMLMILSSLTAIYSSLNANWEQDLKKIIALSTLSQIAMMMFAISLNMLNLAFFHLIIHALFKSTMFLCAGMMIHNSSYQDMRTMSMKHYNSPTTMIIMGISNLALMGIPFMSGFYSKDTILETMMMSNNNLFIVMLMTSSIGMTTMYSIRMITKSMNKEMKIQENILHNEMMMNMSIITMSSMSIFMGSLMSWLINPSQTTFMPFTFKMLIVLSLLSGIIMSISLNFKSKMYFNMGPTIISMWFIHMMSSNLFQPLQNNMKMFMINDNSWKETYGPQKSFSVMKNMSINPNMMNMTMMFMMIIIMMIPLTMLL